MPNAFALTIHQPYAWAIVHGHKPVENRPWSPRRDLTWLLIHAGKKVADDEAYAAAKWQVSEQGGSLPPADKITRGSIVGAARISEVLELGDYEAERGETPWATGPICWCFDEVVAFAQPIPCRGMQGLWPVPEVLLTHVRTQWRAGARKRGAR